MFEAFRPGSADVARRKSLFASTGVAMGIYVALGVGVATMARGATSAVETALDVTFEKLPKKEPEPAPPPPPPPPPPPVKKIEKPKLAPPPVNEPPPPAPTPPPTLIPKVIPKEALPESDRVVEKREFIAPSEGIGGGSRRAGVQGGVPGGTGTAAVAAPAPTSTGPINLPEEATPPVESPDNRRPDYPEAARAAGKEGKVILKIVITEAGTVGNIQVMKGEPPFVEASLAAVRLWKYKPALLAGKPISVFRIVQLPFRLSVGGG